MIVEKLKKKKKKYRKFSRIVRPLKKFPNTVINGFWESFIWFIIKYGFWFLY